MNMGTSEASRLLDKISALDFVLYETRLYLDGHPASAPALKYYRDVSVEREKLVAEYEQKHAPITPSVKEGETMWRWSRTAWPWEVGFPDGGEGIPMAKPEEDA